MRSRPRWILASIAFANLVVAALHFGLAAAGPVLRDQLELGEVGLGVVLAASPAGLMFGTFAWGELADRTDERRVLVGAFVGFAATVALAGAVARRDGDPWSLCIALFAGGLFGSAAHSAGGRAISGAFPPHRHGTVLAIRHTAIPVGGAIGGLLVPGIARGRGLDDALGLLAGAGLVAAVGVFAALPRRRLARASRDASSVASRSASPLRARSLWLLGIGCAALAFVQLGIGSFLTIHLVDEAGLGLTAAASLYAAAQLCGAVGRIVLGIASDRVPSRPALLRGVACAVAAVVAGVLVAPSGGASGSLLLVAFVVATSWNGVAVAAAAALAPAGRTGATLGMQTTLNALACTIAPVALGAALHVGGWRAFEATLLASLVLSVACLTAVLVSPAGGRLQPPASASR